MTYTLYVMPRAKRLIKENGWYHVMNRGHSRKHIFLNDQHRIKFLDLLEIITERYEIEVHSYCLMGNHYHLLIHTPSNHTNFNKLSLAIKYLNASYALFFNKTRKRDGFLFKGRFKSILLQNDRSITNVSRYIHLNPVEAGLTTNPMAYKWSSCRYFFNRKWTHHFLKRTYILERVQDYIAYINAGVPEKIREVYTSERLISSF